MDSLDIDCSHDVDPPITMLHASETSSFLDLPIYDEYDDEHVELPSCDAMIHRISCENSFGHIMFDNPLNLSYVMSESILEGVSEPQHLASKIVETACEATMISNDLTSTPSVFSSLVLGLLHDDTPTIDESIPPMETTMAMMDDDAPPHGSIKMKMTTNGSSTPHLQHMSDAPKVT